MTRLTALVASFGLSILVAGCGGGPEVAEVEGKLTRGGAPLKNVRVEFWPASDGPKSTGVTDDQGRYTLKTEDGRTVGALVGAHTVVLKDLDVYGDTFLGRKAENMPTLSKGTKERFAKVYSDPGQTQLKKTVTAGQKNVIDLELP
jgi:hypothetical protein